MDRDKYFRNVDSTLQFYIKTGTEASIVNSKYRPFYTFNLQGPGTYKIENISFVYGIPLTYYENSLKYDYVLDSLLGLNQIQKFKSKANFRITVGKGFILDEYDNFLLLLVATTGKETQAEYDKLFVSYDFFDPKYKLLYKKVYEILIEPALKEGVPMEVISSDKIKSKVLEPIIITCDNFSNVKDYNQFMSEVLSTELFKEEIPLIPIERGLSYITKKVEYYFEKESKILFPESLETVANKVLEFGTMPKNLFENTIDLIPIVVKELEQQGIELTFEEMEEFKDEPPF